MRGTEYFQSAWVVESLDEAMAYWTKICGVGPFYVIPDCAIENYAYRGQSGGALRFSGALAQAGPIQIELIQQHGDDPSAYRDVYPAGTGGFHHVCAFAKDYDADVERYRSAGASVAHSGQFGDMRFCYLDTRSAMGCMTELIEDRQSIRDMFAVVANAAVNWDGSDPIRYL